MTRLNYLNSKNIICDKCTKSLKKVAIEEIKRITETLDVDEIIKQQLAILSISTKHKKREKEKLIKMLISDANNQIRKRISKIEWIEAFFYVEWIKWLHWGRGLERSEIPYWATDKKLWRKAKKLIDKDKYEEDIYYEMISKKYLDIGGKEK